jgi:hypothetical protein
MSGAEGVTIEEMKEKYKNQWVLVEVLEEDESETKKVKFITNRKSRDEIYEVLKEHKGYSFSYRKNPNKGYVWHFMAEVYFDHIRAGLEYTLMVT